MTTIAGQQQHQQVQGGEASSSQHQPSGGTGHQEEEQQQEKLEEPDHSSSNWYFSREYIEKGSPSRRDGIDLKKEAYFRKSYCTFLQDLGMRLKVPQVTIATAIVFCHRFFLRQSHLKNDRYMIATTCMFLAGKVEETPQKLCDVIYLSYEIRNKKDPAAIQKIKQKEVYEPQKELVLLGERLVLTTLGFDLNVHHPYKPLVAAIKKFKVAQNALAQVAWNFVNDGLRTSLCLQFKPHHIAAGAIFLAAKFLKVKLPNEGEKVWWQEFDVTPRQLEEVSNQMLELYEQNRDVSASRSSGPSPSAGVHNHNRTGGEVPSSSAAHAPDRASTAEAEAKTILSDYKEPTGEAQPLCSRGENHSSSGTGLKFVAECKVILGTTKPQTFEDALPQPSEKSSLGEEAMDTDRVGAQVVEDIDNIREESDAPSQVIEENSVEKLRDLNSTTSVDPVSPDMRRTIDNNGQMRHSPQQDLQLKKSWIGLDEVNIDRVKAALKRRKSRGEGGEARPLISRTELTDEEELLERDLENGQKDAPYEENSCRLVHTLVSQNYMVNDGTQSCSRSAIDDEEELLDRNFASDFTLKKKDSNVHPPSLELDVSRGLQKDRESQEREAKRPHIDHVI